MSGQDEGPRLTGGYQPQEPIDLGGPGAGRAIAEGAVAAQFFNLPTSVVATGIGSIVGVVLMLLFAYFVLGRAPEHNTLLYNQCMDHITATVGTPEYTAAATFCINNN